MASVTYHVVLPFIRDDDSGELVAEQGQEAPSAWSAKLRAETMVTAGHKAGAVAFSRTGDPELGDFDDAVILGKFGDVPDDLAGFTSMP